MTAPTSRTSRFRLLRSRWAVTSLTLVTVLVAALVWWATTRDPAPAANQASSPTTASQSAPGPLSQARADELSQQLSSGSEDQLRAALVLPPGQQLDPTFATSLAELQLQLDAATFLATGDDTGTARASTVDQAGAVSTWTVHLLFTQDDWQVLATEPVEGR